ncbi:gamma-glutamyltransferase [Aurantiacibacter xanthus]|uniref:Glutathione hydrolase proenzyme n=1 Tax=Aurantiacibacter xanthus TaxID=1784712 RepID=A0A3A1PFG3_9SPHN|nr:gamma-glutamyltransferase [Aurantiacibacter xanthus]RIV92346.1 gamma-glutamyltransferase [Aurantiacibacter xanthus]
MSHRTIAPLALSLLLAACATVSPVAEAPVAPTAFTAPQTGMVSTADPRASAAGMAILEQGGSATDAAIAVMLALTVVEPQSSGIGGGGFYVHGTPAGEVTTLDGRETAPAGAGPDWFLDDNGAPVAFLDAVKSGLSVGVPGSLALARQAHERYGKLEWAALFQPAIALARDGFVMTPRLNGALDRARDRGGRVPEGQALFYDTAGEPLPVGTVIKNPALAATLERIAAEGPDWLYQGPAGAALADYVAADTPRDGAMVAADVRGYEARWRDPVCGQYRVYRICGMGPPSSGATTVIAILKQLERFDLAALGAASPTAWHLFAESQRLAYADRELYLGDSDFVDVPVAGLVNSAYLTERGRQISPTSTIADPQAGTPPGASLALAAGPQWPESGTSHFAVVDDAGDSVSWTSTVEGPFGSGLMFGGFYLNNELTDFTMVPEVDGVPVANRVEGSKRPRSSMSPTLVYGPEGNLRIAIGAAGGATIPVQTAKALIGVLDWGLTAQEAIALPGLFSPGNTIMLEPGSSLLAMQGELEALGHKVIVREMPFKANAVEFANGHWRGAADPRSEGVALGN